MPYKLLWYLPTKTNRGYDAAIKTARKFAVDFLLIKEKKS